MVDYLDTHGDTIDFAWPALYVLDVTTGKTSKARQHSCLIRRHHPSTEKAYAAIA
jgi:hypothetical protein